VQSAVSKFSEGITFGMEKPERRGYPMVRRTEYMFIRFSRIHERDRQTDRQMDGHQATAYAALMQIMARQ